MQVLKVTRYRRGTSGRSPQGVKPLVMQVMSPPGCTLMYACACGYVRFRVPWLPLRSVSSLAMFACLPMFAYVCWCGLERFRTWFACVHVIVGVACVLILCWQLLPAHAFALLVSVTFCFEELAYNTIFGIDLTIHRFRDFSLINFWRFQRPNWVLE